jgi:peroxin-6
VSPDEEDSDSDDDEDDIEPDESRIATALVYFKVTSLGYEPLVPLEDDFRSSVSSKARAGELGCWVDVGEDGETQLVLEGLERDLVGKRDADRAWHGIRKRSVICD